MPRLFTAVRGRVYRESILASPFWIRFTYHSKYVTFFQYTKITLAFQGG